jgi:hypothetical protein
LDTANPLISLPPSNLSNLYNLKQPSRKFPHRLFATESGTGRFLRLPLKRDARVRPEKVGQVGQVGQVVEIII